MSARTDKLRKKLADGQPSPGMWIALASPMAAEIVADAGLDWVIVDAEHHPFNPETLLHILKAFRGTDTVPIIRVPWNDHVVIKQVLDLGFEGVLTPNTNSVEDARRAVEACRYPPVGKRGAGWTRPGQYGRDQGEYVRTANESIFCAIQIEDIRGAEDVENIVKVPGVDWILIGPADMSGTMGLFPQMFHPDVVEACKKIITTASRAGLPSGSGIALETPEAIREGLALGAQIVPIGGDVTMFRKAIDDNLDMFRNTVGQGAE